MASLGQLLGGAGVVAGSMRQAEEAERVARQNQLQIEAQNRMNRDMARYAREARVAGVQPPQFAPGQDLADVEVAAPPPPPSPVIVQPQVATQERRPAPLPLDTVAAQAGLTKIPTMQLSREQFLSLSPAEQQRRWNEFNAQRGLSLPAAASDAAGFRALRGAGMPTTAPILTMQELVDSLKVTAGTGPSRRGRGRQKTTPEFENIAAAVMQVESGGDPNAVSPVGAIGTMQTMPETLRDPGFGVRPAKDRSPQELERVGKDYLAAMLREFKGNLDHALAAYNWGPGATKNWINRGANFAELPAETQGYIRKVRGLLGGAIEAMVPTAAAAPTPAAGLAMPAAAAPAAPAAPAAAQRPLAPLGALPASQPPQMQQALAQREELVRLANMYLSIRTPQSIEQFTALRSQIAQIDAALPLMVGDQALSEFETFNDPRRLSQVWSYYTGRPIGIQRRSDGTYNIFVDGNLQAEGASMADIYRNARATFDTAYQQQLAETSKTIGLKRLESQLKREEEAQKNEAQLIREIFVERAKGDIQRGIEILKRDFSSDVKPQSDGTLIITSPGQPPYICDPKGREVKIGSFTGMSYAAQPILGLPQYQQ